MDDATPDSNGMYSYRYPRPAVTADTLVFSADRKEILLIRRKNDPYKGCWAFPGGFLNMDETLEQCARRELMEETTVAAGEMFLLEFLEQFPEMSEFPADLPAVVRGGGNAHES